MGPHRQLAAALLAVVVLTSGCDPGHPFDDARVKIQVREDGIALVAADVFPEGMRNGLDAVGDGELSAAVAHAMDVGSIVGEPATYADEFGFETVAVDLLLRSSQAQLTIPLRPLVDALLQHGVDPTATVFFSICHAAGDGGVMPSFGSIHRRTRRWPGWCPRSASGCSRHLARSGSSGWHPDGTGLATPGGARSRLRCSASLRSARLRQSDGGSTTRSSTPVRSSVGHRP